MDKQQKKLREVLQSFDERTDPFYEHKIENAVNQLRMKLKENDEEPNEKLIAEIMAFGFCENYRNESTGWGTYFGPMTVMPNGEGQMMESPSIQRVTINTLEYWSLRAQEANHPILKARYAGLVWDFSQTVTGQQGDPDIARICVDAIIQVASRRLHKFETDTITKLERALSLALSLNDTKRSEKVRDAIIEYEESIAEDNKLGLWGFSFDLLVENKGIVLPNDLKEKIISELEERLGRVSNVSGNSIDQFAAEAVAIRLARYYRRLDKRADVKRVLLKYGNAFLKVAKSAAAIVGSAWLQKVHSVYLDFGMRAEAEKIAVQIRLIAEKCKDEMAVFSHETTISKKEMDEHVESIIGNGLTTALTRIAFNYVPKRETVVDQIKELSKQHPILYIMPQTLQDDKGRPVAHIGPLAEDLDGHVIRQMSMNMGMSAIFLHQVVEELQKKYQPSVEETTAFLYKSPVFEEGKRTIIEAGLRSYFQQDYIAAIHMLIPQIEAAIRVLLEILGGSTYRKGRHKGLFLKTFDELLRQEMIVQSLQEDVSHYLRVLFTDPRGWNIRNSVCHGITPANSFTPAVADRIFQSLLLLGHLRKGDSDVQKSEARRR